jgi:sugar lactone lactonase YvrE
MNVVDDVELVLPARADLGEGPTWDERAQRLIWVDITAGLVHRFDPVTRRDEAVDVGRPVGAAVPASSDGFAIAGSDGFSLVDEQTRDVRLIAAVEPDLPETTMNDGKCDVAGRFWAGTKDDAGARPLGGLYRLDPDHTCTQVLTGVTISNGMGWSLDQRTMYYIDSPTHAIDAFDFQPETGSITNRRHVIDLPDDWGLPDGMTVDEEGLLWVAFYDGSAVRRLTPDGRIISLVRLPVSKVTSCAFAGAGLTDLYVTSARSGLSDEELREQPDAGGVFRIRPGVKGLPQHPFGG